MSFRRSPRPNIEGQNINDLVPGLQEARTRLDQLARSYGFDPQSPTSGQDMARLLQAHPDLKQLQDQVNSILRSQPDLVDQINNTTGGTSADGTIQERHGWFDDMWPFMLGAAGAGLAPFAAGAFGGAAGAGTTAPTATLPATPAITSTALAPLAAGGSTSLLTQLLPSIISGAGRFFGGLGQDDSQERNSFAGKPGVDPATNLGNFYEMIQTLMPALLQQMNAGPSITAMAPPVPGSRLRDPGFRPPTGNQMPQVPMPRPLPLPTDLNPSRTTALRNGPIPRPPSPRFGQSSKPIDEWLRQFANARRQGAPYEGE